MEYNSLNVNTSEQNIQPTEQNDNDKKTIINKQKKAVV